MYFDRTRTSGEMDGTLQISQDMVWRPLNSSYKSEQSYLSTSRDLSGYIKGMSTRVLDNKAKLIIFFITLHTHMGNSQKNMTF